MKIEIIDNIPTHEKVAYCEDLSSGLKAFIAVHNTTLGPALGGTRMWNYTSRNDALDDVLKLSRGMTYKAALAELSLGGGKGVIIGDPKKDKNEVLMRSYGRFVDTFKGDYITAEDVGMTTKDIDIVSQETKHVTGTSISRGGSGDPSVYTALGVYHGIKACAEVYWGKKSLKNRSILVQGLGNVGINLIKNLVKESPVIYVNDIDKDKVDLAFNKFKNLKYLSEKEMYVRNIEIYSPCALGSTLNIFNIPKFKFKIIAGAANNQLQNEKSDAELILRKKILYAPDFMINAGGLINVYSEIANYNKYKSMKLTKKIYETTINIFSKSKSECITTHQAALSLAKDKIKKANVK